MTNFSLLDIFPVISVSRKNTQTAFPKCALQSHGSSLVLHVEEVPSIQQLSCICTQHPFFAWASSVVDPGRSKSPFTARVEHRCRIFPAPAPAPPTHPHQAPLACAYILVNASQFCLPTLSLGNQGCYKAALEPRVVLQRWCGNREMPFETFQSPNLHCSQDNAPRQRTTQL